MGVGGGRVRRTAFFAGTRGDRIVPAPFDFGEDTRASLRRPTLADLAGRANAFIASDHQQKGGPALLATVVIKGSGGH